LPRRDRPRQALRAHKDKVVGKLTGGLAGMAKARKVDIVRGYGSFLDPNHLEVEETTGASQDKTGAKKVVRSRTASSPPAAQAVHLPFMPQDPRIVDSTGALELRQVPRSDAGHRRRHHRPGNGHRLLDARRRVDVVEMLDGLMQGPDRDAVKVWEKQNAHRFDKVMLKTKTVGGRGQGRRPLGQVRRRKAPPPKPVRTT
jgi:dihydrolipoamide dehydrogenase